MNGRSSLSIEYHCCIWELHPRRRSLSRGRSKVCFRPRTSCQSLDRATAVSHHLILVQLKQGCAKLHQCNSEKQAQCGDTKKHGTAGKLNPLGWKSSCWNEWDWWQRRFSTFCGQALWLCTKSLGSPGDVACCLCQSFPAASFWVQTLYAPKTARISHSWFRYTL